jgi:hypothetical protein
VRVDEVFGLTPVTVTRPVELLRVAVPGDAETAQVKLVLLLSVVKLPIETVKPSAVGVGVPKVGFRAALSLVTVIV